MSDRTSPTPSQQNHGFKLSSPSVVSSAPVVSLGVKGVKDIVRHKCSACAKVFNSIPELHSHQVITCHYRCEKCNQDFYSGDALTDHKFKSHPIDQSLVCPGCHLTFARAGGILQHIEDRVCTVITPEYLQEQRTKPKRVAFEQSFQGLQAHKPPVHQGFDVAEPATKLRDAGSWITDEKSIEFGSSSMLWTSPDVNLGDASGETSQTRVTALWANQPSHDPDDPLFNPALFYNRILEKFKCPHMSCSSKFRSAQGLIAHLKSLTHRPEAHVRCPRCERIYQSMAAAMQHAESASVRCNIKTSRNFGQYVSDLSGGLLESDNDPSMLINGCPWFKINPRFMDELHARAEYVEGLSA